MGLSRGHDHSVRTRRLHLIKQSPGHGRDAAHPLQDFEARSLRLQQAVLGGLEPQNEVSSVHGIPIAFIGRDDYSVLFIKPSGLRNACHHAVVLGADHGSRGSRSFAEEGSGGDVPPRAEVLGEFSPPCAYNSRCW